MEFTSGYVSKKGIGIKRPNREMIESNSDTLLVIKLPTSIILRILSRSVFLVMVILTLPSIRSFMRGSSNLLYDPKMLDSNSVDVDIVPLLLRDLVKQGLVNTADRALVLSSDFEKLVDGLGLFEVSEVDLLLESDLGSKNTIINESFDCILALGSRDSEFEDRVLKIGGLLVVKLGDDPSNSFQRLPNYKIVYVSRFNSTIVAMEKISSSNQLLDIEKKVNICSPSEAKKAALKALESPFLEPPRSLELAKSSYYSKEIKFLVDLLKNPLGSYNRKIFISDENENGNDGVMRWFRESYPKKKHYFEEIKTGKLTDWIKRNAKESDFVVVKAEAELVEEMIREKTICLVDELFLECEFHWQGVWEGNKGKRAYWECLTLFGKLREEGVFVHQWWG